MLFRSEEDKANFEQLTQKLIDQYDAFVPTQLAEKYADDPAQAPHVNGALTIGENIGDLSGVNIALKAYAFALDEVAGREKNGSMESIEASLSEAPEIDGFTGLQRFFLSYASIWRTKNRDELAELASASMIFTFSLVMVNVPGLATSPITEIL